MGPFVGLALVWFILEMLLWYLVAQFVSGWYVFFWFIVASIIGLSLLRKGLGVLNPMAQQMKNGGMMNASFRSGSAQESNMIKSVAIAFAGFLLLIPGLLSDVLALFVLLPPVQKLLKNKANDYVMKNQQKMMDMMMKQMGGQMGTQNPFDTNGQSPFGDAFGGKFDDKPSSPFGSNSPFGNNPFGAKTVDGSAKTVNKDAKKLTSANDD